jgi:hypothetical protein
LWLSVLFQVRDSMDPLKQWPTGHLIMALSSGPSVERMMNRHLTSAGSPHRTVPSWSRWAGQFRNIIMASVGHKVGYIDGCCAAGNWKTPRNG